MLANNGDKPPKKANPTLNDIATPVYLIFVGKIPAITLGNVPVITPDITPKTKKLTVIDKRLPCKLISS